MEPKTHKTMVQSFTLANFNYCPYFISAKQINKIEKIQERALRYISDDYDSNNQQLLENSSYQWKLKGSKHYLKLSVI